MRKYLTILLLMVCCVACQATNYYISSTGSDGNNGTSTGTPWQTIAKVNTQFSSFAAGDSILFKRGDTFFGALVAAKSGTNGSSIVIGAYGTGVKPVITGLTTLSSWSLVSTGIYKAAVNAKGTLNFVAVNGKPVQLARQPNSGYLAYESFVSTNSITDDQLLASPSLVGYEVVVRKSHWNIDRNVITAHTGGTLTFRPARAQINGFAFNVYAPDAKGYGYFLQNSSSYLDTAFEWWHDSTNHFVNMYFGAANPASYTIKCSTIDTLIRLGSFSYITIENIKLEGAGLSSVHALGGSGNIIFKNCVIDGSGGKGLHFRTIGNITVQNDTIQHCLSNGIQVLSSGQNTISITGNVVKNTAPFAGMFAYSDGTDGRGITIQSNNIDITGNIVDTTGYSPVEFRGNNVLVNNNSIDYFNFVLDDGSGIYTYRGGTRDAPATHNSNRIIENNVVSNGIGAAAGTANNTNMAHGFYGDGMVDSCIIRNNTFYNIAKNGVNLNNPDGVQVKYNTMYNCSVACVGATRWSWGSISGNVVIGNKFLYTNESQGAFLYANTGTNTPVATTFVQSLKDGFVIDSNYYSFQNEVPFSYLQIDRQGGVEVRVSPQNFAYWKTWSGMDAHSTLLPKYNSFTVGAVGANKATNGGNFTSNISGYTPFGNNTSVTWDNTGQITGGTLRFLFTAPVPRSFSFINSPIGALDNTKKYLLQFTTKGTTENGTVQIYLRQTTNPYTTLTPIQTKFFGTAIKKHTVLFENPPTNAGGSLVISIEQGSGTTYIDNIVFSEVTATSTSFAAFTKFVANSTGATTKINIGDRYISAFGSTVYDQNISLAAYSSAFLLKSSIVKFKTTNRYFNK